jgi:hypothetical protein
MNIEHFILSFSVFGMSRKPEQDGEKLARVTAKREPTASCDPAMAFRNLALAAERTFSSGP